MLPQQSQSNTSTTSHAISTQPTNFKPIVPVPSSKYIYPSLDTLQDVDHLFFEEANNYPVADSTDYSIINDSGQRLFCAHVTYCFKTYWNKKGHRSTVKFIRAIEILDAMKNTVANTSIITGEGLEADPEINPNLNGFKIMIGGQPLGKLNFKYICDCPSEYVLRTRNASFDCSFVSKRGSCCCCCPFYCCGSCCQPFEIYEVVNKELLGQMHRSWPSHPGIFGLSFPDSLDTTKKALLLVTGLYLNAQYFEKHSNCWGHVGLLGKTHYEEMVGLTFVVVLITSVAVLIYVRIHHWH